MFICSRLWGAGRGDILRARLSYRLLPRHSRSDSVKEAGYQRPPQTILPSFQSHLLLASLGWDKIPSLPSSGLQVIFLWKFPEALQPTNSGQHTPQKLAGFDSFSGFGCPNSFRNFSKTGQEALPLPVNWVWFLKEEGILVWFLTL